MGRTFTTREKVLMLVLAVLLVGCFYYLAVLQPSLDTIASSESELAATQSEIVIQQAVSAKKAELEQQLAEAEAAGESLKTLPAYDNTKNEISELNNVLADAGSYTINFTEADLSDSLVRRAVTILFTCDSYETAHSILLKLIDGPYSCLVTDISVNGNNSGQSDGEVTANAIVTYFEKLA